MFLFLTAGSLLGTAILQCGRKAHHLAEKCKQNPAARRRPQGANQGAREKKRCRDGADISPRAYVVSATEHTLLHR